MRTGLTKNYQNVLQLVVKAPSVLEIKNRTTDLVVSFCTGASINGQVTEWSVEGASTQVLANVNAAPNLTVNGSAFLGGADNSIVIEHSTAPGQPNKTYIRYSDHTALNGGPYRNSRPAKWVF